MFLINKMGEIGKLCENVHIFAKELYSAGIALLLIEIMVSSFKTP